jgi:hypothetical protein
MHFNQHTRHHILDRDKETMKSDVTYRGSDLLPWKTDLDNYVVTVPSSSKPLDLHQIIKETVPFFLTIGTVFC